MMGMRDPTEGRSASGLIRTGVAAERIPEAFRAVLAATAEAAARWSEIEPVRVTVSIRY